MIEKLLLSLLISSDIEDHQISITNHCNLLEGEWVIVAEQGLKEGILAPCNLNNVQGIVRLILLSVIVYVIEIAFFS